MVFDWSQADSIPQGVSRRRYSLPQDSRQIALELAQQNQANRSQYKAPEGYQPGQVQSAPVQNTGIGYARNTEKDPVKRSQIDSRRQGAGDRAAEMTWGINQGSRQSDINTNRSLQTLGQVHQMNLGGLEARTNAAMALGRSATQDQIESGLTLGQAGHEWQKDLNNQTYAQRIGVGNQDQAQWERRARIGANKDQADAQRAGYEKDLNYERGLGASQAEQIVWEKRFGFASAEKQKEREAEMNLAQLRAATENAAGARNANMLERQLNQAALGESSRGLNQALATAGGMGTSTSSYRSNTLDDYLRKLQIMIPYSVGRGS